MLQPAIICTNLLRVVFICRYLVPFSQLSVSTGKVYRHEKPMLKFKRDTSACFAVHSFFWAGGCNNQSRSWALQGRHGATQTVIDDDSAFAGSNFAHFKLKRQSLQLLLLLFCSQMNLKNEFVIRKISRVNHSCQKQVPYISKWEQEVCWVTINSIDCVQLFYPPVLKKIKVKKRKNP